jgi:hypothetical protein
MKEIDLKKDRILIVTETPEQAKVLTESFEKYKVISTNCEIIIVRNYK